MYIDAPVSFLVRFAGEPGNIVVTVSSPGLEPAKLTIRSMMPVRNDTEDGISEPETRAVGGGKELSALTKQSAQSARSANSLSFITDDYRCDPAESALYGERIERFLLNLNPAADRHCPAFRALMELMVSHLAKDDGVIVADDFNFNVSRYNDCCTLYEVLDCSTLPAQIITDRKRLYAETIIIRRAELDLQQEIRHINHSVTRDRFDGRGRRADSFKSRSPGQGSDRRRDRSKLTRLYFMSSSSCQPMSEDNNIYRLP